MAFFTRVHGDVKPTVNFDIKESGDTTGVPINPAGPKLDFFSIVLDQNTSPVNQMGTNGAVQAVLNYIGQLATVHMYQVDDATGLGEADAQLSLAIYPAGAWTETALQEGIEGLGTVNGYDLTDARVEIGNGFRLFFDNYC
jgi:hypothetical protein